MAGNMEISHVSTSQSDTTDFVDSPLTYSNENEAQWLERIARGGCFIIADAAINDDVVYHADRLSNGNGALYRFYWQETGRIHGSISPYVIPLTLAN